jgi:hypothetical protein
MAYKDKVPAGMITFMEQLFTVLPTKVVWFLFMMFMTLCVLRVGTMSLYLTEHVRIKSWGVYMV